MEIEKGFYYHYKHDPAGSMNNYAYEIVGVSRHSEDKSASVVYRPLYKNTYLDGFDFCNRPYDMFLESVEKEGKPVPRFQKITDSDTIQKLERIREEMYGKDSL